MFLSDKELMELTGYKRPGEQRRWLASHNWPFEIAANGYNRVLREEARNRLLSRHPRGESSSEPNLAILRELF
jgi:hypothetical protein